MDFVVVNLLDVVMNLVMNLVDFVVDFVINLLDAVTNLMNLLDFVLNFVMNFVMNLVDFVVDFVINVLEVVMNSMNLLDVVMNLVNLVDFVMNLVTNLGQSLVGSVINLEINLVTTFEFVNQMMNLVVDLVDLVVDFVSWTGKPMTHARQLLCFPGKQATRETRLTTLRLKETPNSPRNGPNHIHKPSRIKAAQKSWRTTLKAKTARATTTASPMKSFCSTKTMTKMTPNRKATETTSKNIYYQTKTLQNPLKNRPFVTSQERPGAVYKKPKKNSFFKKEPSKSENRFEK